MLLAALGSRAVFHGWASQKMVFLLSAGLFPPPLFILSVAALLLLIDGIKIRVFSATTPF